tara:strand:+ start:157 stop:855 length:699 start_codon:yes stop_codon:yes gene_type:complete
MSENWIDYWSKKNIWSSSTLWHKNSIILYNYSQKKFLLKNKRILDIGCGSGELIEKVLNDTKFIYGVDISKNYVSICKKKFSQHKNIKIKLFKKNYKSLNKLNKKFDVIFCNSVVQYFTNETQIIELIRSVKKVSTKGTKFLISDIMDKNENKDYLKFILYSFARGYFLSLIYQATILFLNPKQRKLENDYKLLEIDTKKIKNKINKLCKKSVIIEEPITINVNRKHLLMEF